MSDLVRNPEDRFSHNEAHIMLLCFQIVLQQSDAVTDRLRQDNEILNAKVTNHLGLEY